MKKYTRKQLKQPDEFISTTYRALEWLKTHASRVASMVVVALLIIAAFWIYNYFATKRATEVTAKLTKAVEIYSASLLPKDIKPEDLKTPEDGIPRFTTEAKKLEAAGAALTKVIKEGGDLGDLALLMRASLRYERAMYTEAAVDYQKFLDESSDPRLRELALEGLGYCYEATKSWDKALGAFRKIPGQGGQKSYKAMYHEARILAHQGKTKEAVDLLKKVQEKMSGTSLAERASQQLAVIEGK